MTVAAHPTSASSIIRMKAVCARIGLARATVYNLLNPRHKSYDPSFPKQIPLGARAVGFSEQELVTWLQARKATVSNRHPV